MVKKRECGRVSILLICLTGFVIIMGIWVFRPKPGVRPASVPQPPLVQIVEASPDVYRANLRSQGTVVPRREISLVTEVSGKVTQVADNFVVGGAFKSNDVLVELDGRDYRYALINAEAQVASAQRELALEKGQARQAKREWRDLGSAEANALFLRAPQVKAAEAGLAAAKADKDRALLNVQRTKIKAAFNGRVQSKQVDLGQFVPAGTVLGSIYDSTAAEVRLPLSNDQLALASFAPGETINSNAQTLLTLSAEIGGEKKQWQAVLKRVEASIDSTTRFYHIVAQVDQPFNTQIHSQPLLIGLFVEASIPGREFAQVISLPKKALVDKQVFTVDSDDILTLRDITIVDREDDMVWVQSQIEAGEKIVVSDPRVLREGMKVRINNTIADEESLEKL